MILVIVAVLLMLVGSATATMAAGQQQAVNVTKTQVQAYGQHPCPDSPAVLCIGAYAINETIITYPDGHNITIPELPSNPLQYPDH